MTLDPATCEPATPVRVAAALMAQRDCAAIPVVRAGRVLGIITDRDIACRGVALSDDAPILPVEQVMSRPVIAVCPDDPIEKAVGLLEQNRIHHLPVISDDGQLVGVLAQSDIGRRMTNREFGHMARETSIRPRSASLKGATAVIRRGG